MQPETLIRSLLIWMACSAGLLSKGTADGGGVPHPVREGAPFLLERAAAGGVEHDPGLCGVGEVPLLLGEQRRVDPGAPVVAGGSGGILELEQRVDGLLRPDDVEFAAGLE